jgi:hypothetical protein
MEPRREQGPTPWTARGHGRRRPGTRPNLATGHRVEEEEGREASTLCPPGGAPSARDSPRRELCSVADRTRRVADADWCSVAGAPFVFGSSASSALLLCAAGGARDQPVHLARRRSPCCCSLCLATPRRRGRRVRWPARVGRATPAEEPTWAGWERESRGK